MKSECIPGDFYNKLLGSPAKIMAHQRCCCLLTLSCFFYLSSSVFLFHALSYRLSLRSRSFFLQRASLNRDSAVAIDSKREALSFRSEVDGFLPLGEIAQRCFEGEVLNLIATYVRERKNHFETSRRTSSLLQDSTSLPAFLVRPRNPG
jgi:hypothetical protein